MPLPVTFVVLHILINNQPCFLWRYNVQRTDLFLYSEYVTHAWLINRVSGLCWRRVITAWRLKTCNNKGKLQGGGENFFTKMLPICKQYTTIWSVWRIIKNYETISWRAGCMDAQWVIMSNIKFTIHVFIFPVYI